MNLSAYGAMRFPAKLDALMARTRKSQSAIARETGIDQSAISAMTRDARRPYMDQALKLARALGVSLDYLADDGQDEPPAPELTEDERALLNLYRALELDEAEALRRLATPVAGRTGDPWIPGAVRDLTPKGPARRPQAQPDPDPEVIIVPDRVVQDRTDPTQRRVIEDRIREEERRRGKKKPG